MSTPPRRRRPDARSRNTEGGGWLPTIAMGLGVVVAGLGIGALVAVFMQRSGAPAAMRSPIVLVTSTPEIARPTVPAPLAVATIQAPPTPLPSPTPTAALATATPAPPSPRPTPSPSTAPTAKATRAALVAVVASAAPSRVAIVTPVPLSSRTSATTSEATPPASIVTAAPTAEPTAAPAPASPPAAAATSSAESAYDEHASATVRRYLDALIRGDEKTAYVALGGGGGSLSEQAFLDPTARIVSLKVTRIDASNASVGCEIMAAKGRYYATYHVTAATSGPYISQHDYIKV